MATRAQAVTDQDEVVRIMNLLAKVPSPSTRPLPTTRAVRVFRVVPYVIPVAW